MTLLALVVAGANVEACGSSTRVGQRPVHSNSSSTPTALPTSPLDSDEDNDNATASHYDKDDALVIDFGRVPGARESNAIIGLVRRYYVASETANGTRACSMLHPVLRESVVEEFDGSPTPGTPRGKTCAAVVSKLLRRNHHRLAADLAAFKPVMVRVGDATGLVLLHFGKVERRVLLRRDGRAWKIDTLLDVGIP